MKTTWNKFPDTLPPDPGGGWFSPYVWFALKNGKVVKGRVLHKSKEATYEETYHDVFLSDEFGGRQHDGDNIIAWSEITAPKFEGI